MTARRRRKTKLKPLELLALALVAAAALLWEQWSAKSAAPVLARPEGQLAVHVIDVGQGLSVLIDAPEKTVLIDAGENDKGGVVLGYLERAGIDHLDLAIGTHAHSDHIGGLDTVINAIPVGTVFLGDLPDDLVPATKTFTDLLDAIEHNGCAVHSPAAGETVDLGGGALLTVLGPVMEPDSLNNSSIVTRLDFGEASFLFMGDAEEESEEAIAKSGAWLECDILGAGHHGSNTSTHETLLRAAEPKAVFISLSSDNSYGFPHKEFVKRASAYGTIYRTDLSGDIMFTTDGETIHVAGNGLEDTIDAR